jgi:SAM-dependent methyltransferase
MSLKNILIQDNKLKWLDVGCGGRFDEGFDYVDMLDCKSDDTAVQKRYTKLNIIDPHLDDIVALGTYDFVRMQHTLEHFSVEDGIRVLLNCARLLKDDGILLITVPDLRIFINRYLNKDFKNKKKELFYNWARNRIAPDAPDSFYFSIFTHSLESEPHKWCYDSEGLLYSLELCQAFEDMQLIPLDHPLADPPFTHNRPTEDLCIIAKKLSVQG